MQDYLLIKFSLDKEYRDFIDDNINNYENIGFEVDDPDEKRELLLELPEWEVSDIEIQDDGLIHYGVYFEETNDGRRQLQNLVDFLSENIDDFSYESEHIDNSNWEEEWKKSYTSFTIGKYILIKPSWEEVDEEEKIVIEIEPKMAFGTGTHETTSMCMEYVENEDFSGKDVLDIGCGSGILSILAKKLGAKSVDACDIDPIAIDSTNDNARINNVDVNAFESDLFSNVECKYDVIFANILAEILVRMIPQTEKYLNEDGILVLSGIIIQREDMVKNALIENGYEIIDIMRKGEWSLISARRKDV